MEQQKIGSFLKELRQEKGITQEQLAEEFHTTNRSVSRWENGKSMPDISLLVELAEFYDVDVRELLDRERKSDVEKEEVKGIASKMADYAEEQNGRLLIWVRRISLLGVMLLAMVLALQTFTYEPGIVSFFCYVLSVAAFIIMVIMALNANGKLEKLVTRKNFIMGCKVLVTVVGVAVLSFVARVFFLIALVVLEFSIPFRGQSGMEYYDKEAIVKEYGGDIDSGLFVFPDNTDKMLTSMFESSFKTGLFDSDGYIILQGSYNREDYQKEVERLAGIECTVADIPMGICYDTKSYNLPAYVAVDGYDYVYEYALVDEENLEITYILLSYPEFVDLSKYEEYLKLDSSAYEIGDVLNQFSIYARYCEEGDYWLEYTDETP